VQLQVTLLRDREGGPVRFIAQIQDISGRRRDEEQLRHMANHDPLTGLLNRRSFERALSNQLAHVRRYGTSSALLFIDLDDFKYVNDSLGHAEGDKLIVRVAETLTAELRDTDVLARLGGDEFAVLLPHAEPAHARVVADKLLRQIAGLQVSMNGHGAASLTASAGIAILDHEFPTADDVLVAADLAMYDAKETGKNRYLSYRTDSDYEPRIKARMAWLEKIKRALLDGGAGFVLYAQPIVDVQSGEVIQHELLVRMVGEGGELIAPGTFLPVAERFDLIQELDRVVIARAIDTLADHSHSTISRVAVNVSAKSLADPALPDFIEGALYDAGVDPARVCFEITETAAISNIPLARRFGERLAEIGCELALDDFGAGYGSFYYLKHLPFDYLKIDGEFITDCVNSTTDQLVIDAVVSLTHGLGKRTIAEFVSDEATLRYLRDHGVNLAQGFHIGRPQPLERLLGADAPPPGLTPAPPPTVP
jgi:diguanylate cyclase (GGDEF)-like protein